MGRAGVVADGEVAVFDDRPEPGEGELGGDHRIGRVFGDKIGIRPLPFASPDQDAAGLVKVERELKRREVDKKLIGDKRRLHYAYEITLENLLPTEARVTLHDHPFNKDIEISEVYEEPFREMWMREGHQLFDPLRKL